jgi:VIT1/CCC1 family predicted Fe2+/Mn2+ transporter
VYTFHEIYAPGRYDDGSVILSSDMKPILSPHPEEIHKSHRSAWLRAAILGVDDGIVSTSSLMLGVSAATASHLAILTAGIAGLVAGALSMAVGEYISVSSQRDSERADIAIEARSIAANPKEELEELSLIYEKRGLDPNLARQVAIQLHHGDAVVAHARDELGIDHEALANPFQAMAASAISFSLGAAVPILAALFAYGQTAIVIIAFSLLALAISGASGAFIGGGKKVRAASRVLVGGGIAMAVTSLIGHIIGHSL